MNHLELKNSVLLDLQLITDMAVEDIKNERVKNGRHDTGELIENAGWLGKKREDRIYMLIGDHSDLFPDENIELKYCGGKYTFPIQQAPNT